MNECLLSLLKDTINNSNMKIIGQPVILHENLLILRLKYISPNLQTPLEGCQSHVGGGVSCRAVSCYVRAMRRSENYDK